MAIFGSELRCDLWTATNRSDKKWPPIRNNNSFIASPSSSSSPSSSFSFSTSSSLHIEIVRQSQLKHFFCELSKMLKVKSENKQIKGVCVLRNECRNRSRPNEEEKRNAAWIWFVFGQWCRNGGLIQFEMRKVEKIDIGRKAGNRKRWQAVGRADEWWSIGAQWRAADDAHASQDELKDGRADRRRDHFKVVWLIRDRGSGQTLIL